MWKANSLTFKQALLPAAGAVVSFHLAYSGERWSWMILFFLACLLQIARTNTWRKTFYGGLLVGLLMYAPQLLFFWKLFQMGAIGLWCVLAFWLALFLVLARGCLLRFGGSGLALAAPFLWTGLEYFRGELYYLKFTWLNVGYVFSFSDKLPMYAWLGVYGIGFLAMSLVVVFHLVPKLGKVITVILLIFFIMLPKLKPAGPIPGTKVLRVAGVQMEFPNPAQVILGLDQAAHNYPPADLLVLSEITFDGPVPEMVKNWCRTHRKYLIAGGKEILPGNQFYNTAYVVDTNGVVVFQQVKAVPVQFMKDGLPAREQKLWASPWGKIGLGICYDASYRRVTDELVRQGAQAIIFPTMDIEEWGEHEHTMHSRIAPMRAAEFNIPIFRLCSSGISQFIARGGTVLASAPYPGQNWMLYAEAGLPSKGRTPLDHWLAPLCVVATFIMAAWLAIGGTQSRGAKTGSPRLHIPLRRL